MASHEQDLPQQETPVSLRPDRKENGPFSGREKPASSFEFEPTARRAYEAQLNPLLVEQDEDDLPEESLLQKTESTFVGFSVPQLGHFSSVPSSPTFCRASNL
jgi:hypothetical protein